MSFKSRVSHRKRGRAGSRISYGGTHALARDAELAVVGAGYGNGYPTALSNRAEALIGGVRRPVLGRVCMDQFVVDVSESPPVGVGEEVVLIGSQGEATIGADELGERAGSSAYEALCLAGNLNPRILVGA
jgi:alanine racemase